MPCTRERLRGLVLAAAAVVHGVDVNVNVDPGCSGTGEGRLELGRVEGNNLGGAGPDLGDPEVLQYGHVASVDGRCVLLELRVTDGSSYDTSPEEAAKNGAAEIGSHLGVINLQARSRTDLEARLLDCDSRRPARLSKFNLTFYAVNAPATRQITVRGYWAYYLDDPALFQKSYTDYGTTFVDSAPCSAAVGTRPCALTYFFQDTNHVSMTLETLGPAQPFFFGGSSCKSFHLPDNRCPANICDLGYRLRSAAPDCAGPVCRMEECCVRSYSLCSSSVCGITHKLKAASSLPQECAGEVCTLSECCTKAWVADEQRDAGAAAISSVQAVASCEGHERQYHQCEGLPECNPCVPKDCEFGGWSDWAAAGGCSGLCKRSRTTSGNNECGTPCSGPTEETVARLDDPLCYPQHCKVRNVDCQWNVWSEWTHCEKECPTCMLGQSYRERSVKVKQVGGGELCQGSWNMTRPCKLTDAIDCEMTEWASWTQCSKPCGTGWRFRNRRVLQKAEFGGKTCGTDGDIAEGIALKQSDSCNEQACSAPEPCMLDAWTDWVGCASESPHQKYRSREILMPAMGDNPKCSYPLNETAACPVKLAKTPSVCGFAEWTEWSACSATCEGQHYRSRRMTGNEETCVLSGGGRSLREAKACGAEKCWEDKCELSTWAGWSSCSSACGLGVTQRTRQVNALGHEGGCTAALSEVKACDNTACDPVDCEWAEWDGWSGCTNSCGGTKRRNRIIKTPPRNGGQPCHVKAKDEVVPCNTESCDNCVDGVWGNWSEWSTCTATCAPAYRMRHKDVKTAANYCGRPALGAEDEYALCDDLEPCQEDRDCEVSDWKEWSACSGTCFGVQERGRHITKHASGKGKKCEESSLKSVRPCNPGENDVAPEGCGPVLERDCKMGDWNDWSDCLATCGSGQTTRERHVLSPATNGGDSCDGSLRETGVCHARPCDDGLKSSSNCTDCEWGGWSDWSECTTCGAQRFRHRKMTQMADECGEPCDPAAAKEADDCVSECQEKYYCGWTAWEDTSDCTATCGLSTRTRKRELALTKTEAEGGSLFVGTKGSSCDGKQVDIAHCDVDACPAECKPQSCEFGEWQDWGDCSCNQLRERERVIRTNARCGGDQCDGNVLETERCEKVCSAPVDCQLGDWEEWSPAVCGTPGDQRLRLRKVVREPANGGKVCEGVVNETSTCEEHVRQSVDCSLHEWEPWANCTASCGGGLKTRTRTIKRMGANGGRTCEGDLEEMHECNTHSCETKHVDCKLGDWAAWTSCEGMTTRFRLRLIVQQPEGLGEPCSGAMKEAEACSEKVDCAVTEWTEWDECDKSCGGGQQTRAREVIMNPSSGGKPCPDTLVVTRGCNENACKSLDCTVTEWSAWGNCNVQCGMGSKSRSRDYTSRPCEDGRGCDLDLEEVKPCAMTACACRDCKWGDWETWSSCSVPCDGGQRSRQRHIIVAADPGCKPCDALEKEEVEACGMGRCHDKVCTDGVWGEWQDWEACSATCKGGQTWRSRAMQTEANDCGRPATGLSVEHRTCNDHAACEAHVDCLFEEWADWSKCTSRCAGLSRRHRDIKQHGKGSGAFCHGPMEENRHCQVESGIGDWLEKRLYLNFGSPELRQGGGAGDALMRFRKVACQSGETVEQCKGRTVDLTITPKSSYTGCDVDGNGQRGTRFAAINVASGTSVKLEFRLVDSETGDDVPAKDLLIKVFDLDTGLGGTSRESVHTRGFKDYDVSPATSVVVEQELSELTKFSTTRYGTSDDDPEDPTEATPVQESKAVALRFEGVSVVEMSLQVEPGSFCKTFLFAARSCISGECKAEPCPVERHERVDCELKEWDNWGSCDATCGVGQRTRAREVLREPAFGGRPCNAALSQTSNCSAKPCSECTPIDCSWEEWNDWNACDKCDGEMRRYRHIASAATCGGKACRPGSAVEIANCTRSCSEKVFCSWSDWQPFGACSATCGKGTKSRSRYLKAISMPSNNAKQWSSADGMASALDPSELQQKYAELDTRSQRLRTSRLQALALAFVAGCLSLSAVLGACSRGVRRPARPPPQHGYLPAPTDGDQQGGTSYDLRVVRPVA